MKPKSIATAALALLACFLVACGSDSSEPLTKAAFLQQGNEICREATEQRDEDLKAASEDSDGSGGEEEMANFVDAALESVHEMADGLEGLEPPKQEQKEVAAIVRGFNEGIEQTEANPSDGISGSAFEKANEAAARYGLSDCQV